MRCWLTLSHLHTCHPLGDGSYTRRRRRAVGLRWLEAGGGSRRAILLRGTIGSISDRLCLLSWITIASSDRLRGAELASALHLSSYGSIGTTANVEGLCGVSSLLLLAAMRLAGLLSAWRRSRADGTGVCLAIVRMGRLLTIWREAGLLTVIVGSRHDYARQGDETESSTRTRTFQTTRCRCCEWCGRGWKWVVARECSSGRWLWLSRRAWAELWS